MRLFLAIKFNESIKEVLLTIQERWRNLGVRGRFIRSENLHLTLAFIGEYNNPEDIMDALSPVSFAPFVIKIDGAGNFYDTYWAGIAPNDDLFQCVRRIRHALAENTIPYDRKKFLPHITLVRNAQFPAGIAPLLEHLPVAGMKVEKIDLMRSDRGKNGMIYTAIGRLLAE